jgi:acyl dehydratase
VAEYLKAALGALPGASRLPFVPGGGGPLPDMELGQAVRAEPDRVADYARVCGFRFGGELPPTYPHVLAFPLHLRLMTDGTFPFSPVGLVHIGNRIEVRRPLQIGESLDLRVRPGEMVEHPKGRTFAIVTEARTNGDVAWRGESTMLSRGRGGSGGEDAAAPEGDASEDAAREDAAGREGAAAREGAARAEPADFRFVAEWRLPGDLGRRYAAVSGDRNPIHMHSLTAKAFGFPSAIAHGMWTKARCLAALEPLLPRAYEVSVEFLKPILLPSRVTFERAAEHFRVRGGARFHLVGRFRPR